MAISRPGSHQGLESLQDSQCSPGALWPPHGSRESSGEAEAWFALLDSPLAQAGEDKKLN